VTAAGNYRILARWPALPGLANNAGYSVTLPNGEESGSCVDGPRLARSFFESRWRFGLLQSCVRPVDAVGMTAGPDGILGSGPNQSGGLAAL
jgi:hypothetical protein